MDLTLFKASTCSFGTPHAKDLVINGKNTSPNSWVLTKLTINS